MLLSCGHFQLHRQFWPLDQIKNYLIQLAIAMNHDDCHFKFPIQVKMQTLEELEVKIILLFKQYIDPLNCNVHYWT